MIEPDAGNIAAGLRQRAQENEAAQNLMQSGPLGPEGIAGPDPQMVDNLLKWAQVAPTLPAGAMLSVSQAHIDPYSEVGNYLVKNAVPSLLYRKPDNAPDPSSSLQSLFADPARLEALKHLPIDRLSDALGQPNSISGELPAPGFGGGDNSVETAGLSELGGVANAVGAFTREAGTVAQSGLEGVQAAIRPQAAGLSQTITNIAHGEAPGAHEYAGGVPKGPQDITTPSISVPGVSDLPGGDLLGAGLRAIVPGGELPGIGTALTGPHAAGGTDIHFGGPRELLDPGQLTLVQQARGESIGQGLLPGGPALEKAQAAQKAAATVAGHALTPGRALAAFVTTPDSLQHKVVSGFVDGIVAMEADPALLAIGELTQAAKRAQTIGVTTDDAIHATADHLIERLSPESGPILRAWARDNPKIGTISRDLHEAVVDKLRFDPVSVRQLIDQGVLTPRELASAIVGRKAGLISGLHNSVLPNDFQAFLVGPHSDNYTNTVAGLGFTEIGRRTKWGTDAELQLALHEAKTPDEVRQALQDHMETLRSLPSLGHHPVANMRWSQIIPTQFADINDPDSLLMRARQDLAQGKVPQSEWDNFLPDVVRAKGDAPAAFQAFERIGNRVGEVMVNKIPGYQSWVAERDALKAQIKALGDHVVPTPENQALFDRYAAVKAKIKPHDDLAKELTRYVYQQGNTARIWHAEETGGARLVAGLSPSPDGMTAIEGPFGVSELYNQAIPTMGGRGQDVNRKILRAVGTFAPLFNHPVIGKYFADPVFRKLFVDGIFDHLTNWTKSFAMMKPGTGLRILGTQGARMAAAGVGDLAHNPLGTLGLVAGMPDIDITAEQLVSELASHQNKVAAAVGRGTSWQNELGGTEKSIYQGWDDFVRGSPEYVDHWANRLSHTSSEPVAKAVADALAKGEPLDAVKQSVWDGPLAETRQQMIDAKVDWNHGGEYHGYSDDLVKRSNSDAWVDAWAQIVQDETGNHPDLLQKIVDGVGADISPEFTAQLHGLAAAGVGPLTVTGPVKAEMGVAKTAANALSRRAMSAILTFTAQKPMRDLMFIPTIKKLYWGEIERMAPYLNEYDTNALRTLAEHYGVDMGEITKSATHTIDAATADRVAKTYAVKEFGKTFYEPGKRPILIDQLRDILPFANVVREHAQAFLRLAAQNPKALRVVQMGVTDAQQSGYWSKDEFGKMQMALVTGDVMQNLLGANVGLTAEGSRANIAFQGLPTTGPAITMAAPAVLGWFGHNDLSDRILQYTNSYGDPSLKGSIFNTLFPGWWDAAVTSGYLGSIPYVNQIGKPDKYAERMLNQTTMAIMSAQMSTGHYDMHDPNVLLKVWNDSKEKAKTLYLLQTAAKFLSPIAPQFQKNVQLKGGQVVQQYLLSDDFKKMLDANNGDLNKTVLQYIKKYGAEQIFAAEPLTRPLVYGLPTTIEAQLWKEQHSTFAQQYDKIYGYFAPQGKGFDYPAFLRQIDQGERQALDGPTWYKLAEARIGNAIWNQFRTGLGPHLNAAQQAYANSYKAHLQSQYPGFNDDGLKLAADTQKGTIDKFRTAITDPAVKDTPLAKAIGTYLNVRDGALVAQRQLGLTGNQVSTAAAATSIRNGLFAAGTQIASQYPAFANVWDRVFQNEVQTQYDQAANG